MKSRITSLLILLLMMSGSAYSQDNDWSDNIQLDLEASVGTRYKGLQQVNLAFDAGYLLFDRVYPYFRYESSLMLYKHAGLKTYGNTSNIGGGLGVILTQWTETDKRGNEEKFKIELTGNVTTSVGNRDYKNTSYYAGLRLRYDDSFVAFGYRYMNSRDDLMPNYSAFVVSFGL